MWTTAVPADSQVEYGTTASYGSVTALSTAKVASHAVAISGVGGWDDLSLSRAIERCQRLAGRRPGLCFDRIDPDYDFAFTPKRNDRGKRTATVHGDRGQ